MPNFLEMARPFRKCTKDRRAPSKTQSCKLYRLLFPKTKKTKKNQKKPENMTIHLFQGDVKFPLKQALRVQAIFSSANGQALSAGWLVSDRYYVFARAQRRLHDMENRLHGLPPSPPPPPDYHLWSLPFSEPDKFAQ